MATTNPAPFLAIATDKGMSGWGKATGRASFIVYECRDEHERKLAFEYLESRPEMKHVRTNYEKRAGDYSPRNAHITRYDAGKVPSVRTYRTHKSCDESRKARAEYSAACEVDRVMRTLEVCLSCGCIVPMCTRRPTPDEIASHLPACEYVANYGGVS